MRIPKEQIPVKLDVPGAKARQLSDFGTASGVIGAEYFSLGAGTDIAPPARARGRPLSSPPLGIHDLG